MLMRMLSVVLVCLFMIGCASAPISKRSAESATTSQKSIPWETRKAQLENIQSWDTRGSVSITYKNKTDIASLSWQQRQQHYNIIITGPLNVGRVEVAGRPGNASFKQGDKVRVASSPEALIAEELGWQMPVSNLLYWLRGLPAKGSTGDMQFNAAGSLARLTQQGWVIEYTEYTDVNGVSLPRKMQLYNPALQIRLVLRQWVIGS